MANLPKIIDEVASPEMAALQKETKDIMRGKYSYSFTTHTKDSHICQ
jgi:hypothetical protein